ncbi:hypothetical protein V6N11_027336 [Hibiscus sabdariffa]|uniref:Uncharacterized protein n=1 Tax=Hibiscus sabdariffa TaxID=183260 RepID=A0ABR2PGL3_9ROSI
MASDDRITVTVEQPPTATTPLENILDSSMEDEAEISQPSDIDQTPRVVKMAWQPLPPFRLVAAFVDVGNRFSSSVRRAATSNTLASTFQRGHPILTQWVSPLASSMEVVWVLVMSGLPRALVGGSDR